MAGSEPPIQEADPHITKLAIGARMKDKMVQKKRMFSYFIFYFLLCSIAMHVISFQYWRKIKRTSNHLVLPNL